MNFDGRRTLFRVLGVHSFMIVAPESWTAPPALLTFDPRSNKLPLVLLPSRLVLFALFQVLIAAVIWLTQGTFHLHSAAIYWPFAAIGANGVTILALRQALLRERLSLRDIYRFTRGTVGRDIAVAALVFVVIAPLAVFPNMVLARMLFGSADAVTPLMFGRMPPAAALCTLAFPLTIAFAELPLYLGYITPRLAIMTRRKVVAALVTAVFLSLQHCTLPLILDGRFMLWRFGMFLPLALVLAFAFIWRPRLLPYLMIGHALLDLSPVVMIVAGSLR